VSVYQGKILNAAELTAYRRSGFQEANDIYTYLPLDVMLLLTPVKSFSTIPYTGAMQVRLVLFADRTNGGVYATVLRLSVCLSVCRL